MALRIATEMVEALKYKLRTFGVNLECPEEVYCENKSVVTNSNVTVPFLNKIYNYICYHRVREAQATGTMRVGWIPDEYNIADLLTETTMIGNMRHRIVE